MLVLTRKKGESIVIGDDIEVKIVETDGDAVRVGIKAPREVAVHRREVFDAIGKANIDAAKTGRKLVDFKLKK